MSRKRRLIKWVTAALIIGAFGWYCFASTPYLSRYQAISSQLAGKNVNLHCDGRFMWMIHRFSHGQLTKELGFAEIGGTNAYLSPSTCKTLDSLVRHHDKMPRGKSLLKAEEAILVLAHETMHLKGEENESAANCEAGHYSFQVALGLGFSTKESQAFDVFIRSDLEQNSFNQPDIYQVPVDCFTS